MEQSQHSHGQLRKNMKTEIQKKYRPDPTVESHRYVQLFGCYNRILIKWRRQAVRRQRRAVDDVAV